MKEGIEAANRAEAMVSGGDAEGDDDLDWIGLMNDMSRFSFNLRDREIRTPDFYPFAAYLLACLHVR